MSDQTFHETKRLYSFLTRDYQSREEDNSNMCDTTIPPVSISDGASTSLYNDAYNEFNTNTFTITPDLPHSTESCQELFKEVILSWNDLTYEVDTTVKKTLETRTILNQISGQVKSGETIAIIGSSGAGKTTLLNALSGRIVGGRLSGKVLFCGSPRHPDCFKHATAYVQQDDLMHPLLTVQETLSYAAKLRLPNSQYSANNKINRVSAILQQLRLVGVRNTHIGNTKTRGVSGGERKRVSIGAELLTDPRLLFLDEPTSGLDSNSSQLVVELVKNIARERGIAVLMTIHQPSARIFNTFDKVILLSQGHLVYFGPTSTAIQYFSNIGYQCPVHENPADYFVDLMTLDYRNEHTLTESKNRVSVLVYNYMRYAAKRMYEGQLDTGQHTPNNTCASDVSDMTDLIPPTPHTQTWNCWMYEYKTLISRDWVNIMRNTPYLVSQAMQSLFTGLIVGFMFYYLKHDPISVQNRMGILYTIALNATFPIIMPALQAFYEERDIMLRERSSAVYRVTTFYISKVTTFMPISLACGVIFTTSVYFISRLTLTASKFFTALSVFSCLNVVSISFMLMIGSAIGTMDVAFVVAPAIVIIELLFGGLIANPTTITAALGWIRWINPVYYAYAALVKNEFDSQVFECTPGAQCYTTGEQVIEVNGMGRFSILQDSLFLLLIAAVFNTIAYALLRWRAMPRYIMI